MKSRGVLLVLLGCLLTVSLFAGGKKEEYFPVDGLNNWSYTVDVKDFKEGKYNLIIKAVDEAGNEEFLGPYNFRVDPDSDLPVVRISNPRPNMRIGNLLNIVGTCVDDDAVSKVMLTIDEDKSYMAEGKDFWSYRMDVSTLEDGLHTITAQGVDINGLEGPPVTTTFVLDKTNPVNKILSHENGVLVSGKVTFEGEINDPNGIEQLFYSDDGGISFTPAKFSFDKKNNLYSFKLAVDTKKMEDGPAVYWIKSIDKTQSVGVSPFLFFVDNQGPELNIFYPLEERTALGTFSVSGRVFDAIGIKSFTYQTTKDKEPQVIPITQGNPYWTQDFNFSGEKGSNTVITFRLEDMTGNIVTEKLKVNLDYDSDLPLVSLAYPRADAVLQTHQTFFAGYCSDDDGIKEIEYSIDGKDPITLESNGGFSVPMENLSSGSHKITISAVDIFGLKGPSVTRTFQVKPSTPVITLQSFAVGENTQLWQDGFVVDPLMGGAILGTLRSNDTKTSLTYTLGDGDPVKVSLKTNSEDPSVKTFSIPIKKKMPAQRYNLVFSAVDSFGTTGHKGTAFYVPPINEEGLVEYDQIMESPGLFFLHPHVQEDGRLLVSEDYPLSGWFFGGELSNVSLSKDVEGLNIEIEGNQFIMTPDKEIVEDNLYFSAQSADGETFQSEPFSLTTDYTSPVFNTVTPNNGHWVKGEAEVSGSVTENDITLTLEYSLDGESWVTLSPEGSAGSWSFNKTIPLASLEDGGTGILYRAQDSSGNTSYYYSLVYKDTVVPEVEFFSPLSEYAVYRLTTVSGLINDQGQIASMEYRTNNGAWESLDPDKFISFALDLAAQDSLPEGYLFRVTDLSGNVTEVPVTMTIDAAADKPVVEIQTPTDGGFVKSDFDISGMVFDDDGVAAIYYSLDGGEFQKAGEGNSFSIPIALADISEAEHEVRVRAEDNGGTGSDIVSARFTVSKEEPKTKVLYPLVENTVSGTIVLKGETSDANGISDVMLSFDNGHTFHKAQGTEEWSYIFNTSILMDGTYSVLVRAHDKTETEGLFVTLINIDNQRPNITLDTPLDGAILKDKTLLQGTGFDNIGLESLKMHLLPVSGKSGESVFTYDLPDIGVFAEEVDISSVAKGNYILRVEGIDAAGNKHFASRTVVVDHEFNDASVEIFYPLAGEEVRYQMMTSGKFSGDNLDTLRMYIDGESYGLLELSKEGYFRKNLYPEELTAGEHSVKVVGKLLDGTIVESEERTMKYNPYGGWISIDSLDPGSAISGRPFLEGEAGYNIAPLDPELQDDKEAVKAYNKKSKDMRPVKIEVSMDNGRTFKKARGTEKWKFRMETHEMAEGETKIFIRAHFPDGKTYTRSLIELDKTKPDMTLLSPFEDKRFNDSLTIIGLSKDNYELASVTAAVREGDKRRYEVPGFIQGLYLDGHGLGATYFDIGVGLTFFDDNVKLQLQVGWAEEQYDGGVAGRFRGLVLGGKILANVVHIPFSFFFGPGWSFLSANIAIGANFSWFSNTNVITEGEEVFTDAGLILGSIVGQVEFPKIEFESTFFTYVSTYFEAQLWFISSDVEGGVAFKPAFGVRVGLF